MGFRMKKLFRGLIMEAGSDTLSMGRLQGWMVFIGALVLWSMSKEIQFYHFVTLLSLMGYNLGKKFVDAAKSFIDIKRLMVTTQSGGTNGATETGKPVE